MEPIESARFIFDTSGLLSVLEPHLGVSRRTLPGRTMSRLAKLGMIIVPDLVAREVRSQSEKASKWLDRNEIHIQVPDGLEHQEHLETVKHVGRRLPSFTSSRADVQGAVIALALKELQTDARKTVSEYIVVHDIAYEAACLLLGLATVRPEPFVEAFGALPMYRQAS